MATKLVVVTTIVKFYLFFWIKMFDKTQKEYRLIINKPNANNRLTRAIYECETPNCVKEITSHARAIFAL
jgi:hypothetical protein